MVKSILKHFFYFLVVSMAVIACNDDDIRDPYQPVTLPKINQLNFTSDNDSSIFIYDTDMILASGRDNTVGNNAWKESFVMEYQNHLLTGATYEYVMAGRNETRSVTFKRNDFSMLSAVTSETWTKNLSFTYDDSYRLSLIYLIEGRTENRYTITYNGSNVATVELHKISENGGEESTKMEYSGYDSYMNPFHFLVNVFYAPAFASSYGPVRFDNLPLGILLSANNPKTAVSYAKNGDNWEKGETTDYSYKYDNNNYPISISGGNLSLIIEYK